MKKILLTAALLGAVTCSYAQGVVNWANNSTTLVSANGAATPSAAGGFVYGLFWAPSTITTATGIGDTNWTFAGVYGTNTTAASGGRFGGGFNTLGGANPPAAGATVSLLVRGWSANVAGQNWAQVVTWYNANPAGEPNVAFTGNYGQSGIGTLGLGGGPLSIPSLFGVGAGQIPTGFTLAQIVPIPEPTSFALAGLGAAAMLIFRRRN